MPLEVVNLKQLTKLYLSSSKLIGQIPVTLGECQNLVTIQMGGNVLTGNIPLSFSKLKSLSTLNLSHNNLSGTIPIYLSDLQLLIQLDLSYNNLQGEIPTNGVSKNATAVSLGGNLGFCGGVVDFHMPPCPGISWRTERYYYLVKVLVPIFGFMSLALLAYCIIIHEKKTLKKMHLLMPVFGTKLPKVSYRDIVQATGNFSETNLIGRGSYSSVYRGKLNQVKTEVAIKVLDLEMRGAERSFLLECEALKSIRHRNLIPLITACSTIDHKGNACKALIYAFMPNGDLDTWLHHQEVQTAPKNLGLAERISIAINIADALEYLHHDSGRPIIHCDLKPSNILLDIHMNACLGDFGIARFYLDYISRSVGDSNSISAKGTVGYTAPGISYDIS